MLLQPKQPEESALDSSTETVGRLSGVRPVARLSTKVALIVQNELQFSGGLVGVSERVGHDRDMHAAVLKLLCFREEGVTRHQIRLTHYME